MSRSGPDGSDNSRLVNEDLDGLGKVKRYVDSLERLSEPFIPLEKFSELQEAFCLVVDEVNRYREEHLGLPRVVITERMYRLIPAAAYDANPVFSSVGGPGFFDSILEMSYMRFDEATYESSPHYKAFQLYGMAHEGMHMGNRQDFQTNSDGGIMALLQEGLVDSFAVRVYHEKLKPRFLASHGEVSKGQPEEVLFVEERGCLMSSYPANIQLVRQMKEDLSDAFPSLERAVWLRDEPEMERIFRDCYGDFVNSFNVDAATLCQFLVLRRIGQKYKKLALEDATGAE